MRPTLCCSLAMQVGQLRRPTVSSRLTMLESELGGTRRGERQSTGRAGCRDRFGAIAAWACTTAIANFKNSDNTVNLSDGGRLRSTSGNQLGAVPAA
jgi:hypothetical protein